MKALFLRSSSPSPFWGCRWLPIWQLMPQVIMPPRLSKEEFSHVIPPKCLLLLLPLLLTTPVIAEGQEREVYLPMQQFDLTIDHVHAQCASIDPEFSQEFYDCFDGIMEGIYIDSSTIRKLNSN